MQTERWCLHVHDLQPRGVKSKGNAVYCIVEDDVPLLGLAVPLWFPKNWTPLMFP